MKLFNLKLLIGLMLLLNVFKPSAQNIASHKEILKLMGCRFEITATATDKSIAQQAYFPSRMALLYLYFPMQAKNKLAPELKKQNELLAEKYNRNGSFPNLVLIDINGKELGQLKYTHQTPAVFIQQCNDLLSKVAVNK